MIHIYLYITDLCTCTRKLYAIIVQLFKTDIKYMYAIRETRRDFI